MGGSIYSKTQVSDLLSCCMSVFRSSLDASACKRIVVLKSLIFMVLIETCI